MISASEAKRIALDARKNREGDAQLEQAIDAAITDAFSDDERDAAVVVVPTRGADEKCIERVRKVYASNGWQTRVGPDALELWVQS